MREPFIDYLRTSLDLMRKAGSAARAGRRTPDEPPEEDRRALLDHAFERYFETSGLFGTPEALPARRSTGCGPSASTRSPA